MNFQKIKWDECDLTLGRGRIYKASTKADTANFLGPANCRSLIDGACNMAFLARSDGMSRCSQGETILQITRRCAVKGFKSQKQHLELDSEACWQQVQLTEQR